MAFSENVMEHARYVNGVFTYYAEITCDTAADIPDPVEHPNWEAGSKLYVLESGGSCYRLSNSREWKPVNFDNIGEGGEGGLDPENFYTMQQVDVLIGNVQNAADANTADISVLQENDQRMSRTVTAATEQEVREALQFAAEHPGCYLSLTLAAGLNVVVPTLYIRNATIMIVGTKIDDANCSTITFEQTSTTSNLHLQNTSLLLRNVSLIGNHNHSTGGYGIVRAEYGSSVTCENVVFGQSDDSLNFGNNIEIRDASRAYIVNTVFRSLSTAANACGVYLTSNGEAVAKNCSFAEDSAVQNIARLESGAAFNQIGTEYGVYMAVGHASVYSVDGIQRVPVDIGALAAAANAQSVITEATVKDRVELDVMEDVLF